MNAAKIEDRVRKLLRLAGNNPNVNEAASAFAKAQELATLHGLNLEDLPIDEAAEAAPRDIGPVCSTEIESWDRAVSWKLTVAEGVARANGCRVSYRSGCGGGIDAHGQDADTKTTRYVYLAIVRTIDEMARRAVQEYRDDPGLDPRFDESPRSYGRSWRIGCADAVRRRLTARAEVVEQRRAEVTEQRRQAIVGDGDLANATNALVRVAQAEEWIAAAEGALDDFWESQKWGTAQSFAGASSGSGYASGRAAGSTMGLGSGGPAIGGGR